MWRSTVKAAVTGTCEAMFGGEFGAFRSRDRHVFDEDAPVCRELFKVLALRAESLPLHRGRQFLRQISGDGDNFGLPRMLGGRLPSTVLWSRVFSDREVLLAINTDPDTARTAWVTIDHDLHAEGDVLSCLYSSDPAQIGVESRNGCAGRLTVPPGGFVVWRE